jgi:hypothetical protein
MPVKTTMEEITVEETMAVMMEEEASNDWDA